MRFPPSPELSPGTNSLQSRSGNTESLKAKRDDRYLDAVRDARRTVDEKTKLLSPKQPQKKYDAKTRSTEEERVEALKDIGAKESTSKKSEEVIERIRVFRRELSSQLISAKSKREPIDLDRILHLAEQVLKDVQPTLDEISAFCTNQESITTEPTKAIEGLISCVEMIPSGFSGFITRAIMSDKEKKYIVNAIESKLWNDVVPALTRVKDVLNSKANSMREAMEKEIEREIEEDLSVKQNEAFDQHKAWRQIRVFLNIYIGELGEISKGANEVSLDFDCIFKELKQILPGLDYDSFKSVSGLVKELKMAIRRGSAELVLSCLKELHEKSTLCKEWAYISKARKIQSQKEKSGGVKSKIISPVQSFPPKIDEFEDCVREAALYLEMGLPLKAKNSLKKAQINYSHLCKSPNDDIKERRSRLLKEKNEIAQRVQSLLGVDVTPEEIRSEPAQELTLVSLPPVPTFDDPAITQILVRIEENTLRENDQVDLMRLVFELSENEFNAGAQEQSKPNQGESEEEEKFALDRRKGEFLCKVLPRISTPDRTLLTAAGITAGYLHYLLFSQNSLDFSSGQVGILSEKDITVLCRFLEKMSKDDSKRMVKLNLAGQQNFGRYAARLICESCKYSSKWSASIVNFSNTGVKKSDLITFEKILSLDAAKIHMENDTIPGGSWLTNCLSGMKGEDKRISLRNSTLSAFDLEAIRNLNANNKIKIET